MGILRAIGSRALAAAVTDAPVGTVATSEGALRDVDPVAAAAFGIPVDGTAITRKDAMRVPGIRRGRNLIAGTIGTLPLVATRELSAGVEPVPAGASVAKLLRQLDPRTTPSYVLTWTVDDLIFRGVAWWRVIARDWTNYPVAIERLPADRVVVDHQRGVVTYEGADLDDRDVIRFDGPDDGILTNDGVAVVRLALALLAAGQRQADDDWSGLVLRLAPGAEELTPGQITKLLDAWDNARATRSTAYLNRAVDPEKVSISASERQLTELSQLVASELARLLNLPASRIGAPQGSGMTYTNTEADRRDLVDTTLRLYLTPIEQRLSMGDVCPAGQLARWDLTGYLRGDTTQLVSAGKTAIDAGLTDAPEWRTRVMGLPPRTDLPTPAPAPANPEEG